MLWPGLPTPVASGVVAYVIYLSLMNQVLVALGM